MPQGGGRRSVPFSGKKKKEQLRAKKERKINIPNPKYNNSEIDDDGNSYGYVTIVADALESKKGPSHLDAIEELNIQPHAQQQASSSRYNLKFRKEKDEEKQRLKALHHAEINFLSDSDMEIEINEFYPPGLDFPTRPTWRKNMSKKELDHQENRYFRLFCDNLEKNFAHEDLSLYELNLETWRQLWRVIEMADILLIIVDARYVACQFPPYVYKELSEKRNTSIILVMNKCDLVPPELVLAWEKYLLSQFPSIVLVPFSSLEGVRKKRGIMRMAAESSLRLVEACKKLVGDKVNLDSWRNKIEEEKDIDIDGECEVQENILVEESDTSPLEHQRFMDGILTIGTIGHPNVGKSSLINALMGKKVVSVSRTPGHTKHFQTIFLTPKVKLCDCPGLVFPSRVSKPMQVLHGSYPIAQCRDPISSVHYMASRINVPEILKLNHPDGNNAQWTPFFICEAWAKKRGFFLRTKGGRADTSRAANELLRLCLNGHRSLIMSFAPPGFHENINFFKNDERIKDIILIQGIKDDTAIEEFEGKRLEDQLLFQDSSEESEDTDDEDEEMSSEAPCSNAFNLLMDGDDV